MKKYQILAFALFVAFYSFSQKSEIENWQKKNSQVEFISQERFNSLSSEEMEILKKQEYIIFYEQITVSDINNYAIQKGISGINSKPNQTVVKSNKDAAFIKEWIDQNRDVKIMKRSDFDNLQSSEQEFILNNSKHLVLATDEITKEDITNFKK